MEEPRASLEEAEPLVRTASKAHLHDVAMSHPSAQEVGQLGDSPGALSILRAARPVRSPHEEPQVGRQVLRESIQTMKPYIKHHQLLTQTCRGLWSRSLHSALVMNTRLVPSFLGGTPTVVTLDVPRRKPSRVCQVPSEEILA